MIFTAALTGGQSCGCSSDPQSTGLTKRPDSGAWDEDRAGVEVVKALEMFKVPFTGASSEFYDHGPFCRPTVLNIVIFI